MEGFSLRRGREDESGRELQAKLGQDKTGQARTGRDRTGQGETGQDTRGQDRRASEKSKDGAIGVALPGWRFCVRACLLVLLTLLQRRRKEGTYRKVGCGTWCGMWCGCGGCEQSRRWYVVVVYAVVVVVVVVLDGGGLGLDI